MPWAIEIFTDPSTWYTTYVCARAHPAKVYKRSASWRFPGTALPRDSQCTVQLSSFSQLLYQIPRVEARMLCKVRMPKVQLSDGDIDHQRCTNKGPVNTLLLMILRCPSDTPHNLTELVSILQRGIRCLHEFFGGGLAKCSEASGFRLSHRLGANSTVGLLGCWLLHHSGQLSVSP